MLTLVENDEEEKRMGNRRNSENVFIYLKENIMKGIWKSGERITPEIQLADKLGVSRNSVREAIEKLVGLGILVKMKGKGTYVKESGSNINFNEFLRSSMLDKTEYMDVLVFRMGFETENIKLFIRNAEKEDYRRLEDAYDKMVEFQNDSSKFSYYDALFHNIIAQGTKNVVILKISEILSGIMEHHQKGLNKILGSKSGLKEHRFILEAVKERDVDLAVLYIRKHVRRTIKDVEHVKSN